MSQKLSQAKYDTMEEFGNYIELVFSNCRKFNPPGTYPAICADIVEKVFKKEWPKAMEMKLSWAEKRGLQGVMTTLVKEDMYVHFFLSYIPIHRSLTNCPLSSWVFREPVDPVLLGIPTYFDIIPRKDARDLRTIRQKLDADKYDTVEAYESDMALMVRNAIKFNGADSDVGQLATALHNRSKELLANWKSGTTKKRKEGDRGTPGPQSAKKARLS